MRLRGRTIGWRGATVLLAVLLAGCSTAIDGNGITRASTTYRLNPPPIEVQQHVIALGDQRLSVPVPAGATIGPPRTVQVGDCAVLVLVVPTVYGRDLEVSSARDDCSLGSQRALNGYIGYYRSFGDVAEGGASTARATPVGPASLGSIRYTECTNSCLTVDLPVAFVRLSAPADPERTVIQVLERPWQVRGDHGRVDFEAYLDRLAPA